VAFWVSRVGQGKEQSCCCFWPRDGEKIAAFIKRECAPGQGGSCKAALFKQGQPQDDFAGRQHSKAWHQSKMLFHLAVWGGLFLPLASPGGDERPSCGLCTALESGLSNLGKACSSFFFSFSPLSIKFLDTKQKKIEKTLQSDHNVSTAPLDDCLWSFAVRSAEPCARLLVNVSGTAWHPLHFLPRIYLQ